MGFNELITAAQTGDAYAQFELGRSYYYGNGTPIDKMKAVEWWKKWTLKCANCFRTSLLPR